MYIHFKNEQNMTFKCTGFESEMKMSFDVGKYNYWFICMNEYTVVEGKMSL